MKCKYLDYGHTAPKEYGKFCTKNDDIILLKKDECNQCKLKEKDIEMKTKLRKVCDRCGKEFNMHRRICPYCSWSESEKEIKNLMKIY